MAFKISEDHRNDDGIDDSEQDSFERQTFLNHSPPRWAENSRVTTFSKIMAIVNFVLGVILATSLGLVAHSMTEACPQSVTQIVDPWSPALEAVVPVIRKFKPELIFQSETSDLVEAAWKKLLGASNGVVALGSEDSAKLAKISHESIASIYEPEKHIYGISMYHQLHCLNIIRKSFYREKFYPNVTDGDFNSQKNQCFDCLRQVILCHGDVSMTYWWNEKYTTSLSDGTQLYSDWFNAATDIERAKGSVVFWDVEHSCRMLEPIDAWIEKHPPVPPGVNALEDMENS